MSGAKVITALRERWQVEERLRALLEMHSENELSSEAQQVASSGDQVIPAILKNLGHPDPRMLSVLGTVAAFYPRREQILDELYQAAADLDKPDQSRMSAILILERFLDQEFDPYLVGTLNDPQVVAVESLKQMLNDSERDPFVLIEYARALAGQPEDVSLDLIDTLLEIGKERAVPGLCFLALDQTDSLAVAALHALGRLSHPSALEGLRSLFPLLPPARRALGERSALKLQLKGVSAPPLRPVEANWRTLVGPVDGQGGRVIWFIRDLDVEGICWFLGLSIGESTGIEQAYGHSRAPASLFPERRQPGYLHRVIMQSSSETAASDSAHSHKAVGDQPEGPALHLLEADFQYGRRLVGEAQALNLRLGKAFPAEYCLLAPSLWQYSDEEGESNSYSPTGCGHRLSESADLLAYPVFTGWFIQGEPVLQATVSMLKWMPVLFPEGVHSWARTLAGEYFDSSKLERLQMRLQTMTEWLGRAGEMHLAELAACAAATVTAVPPAEHPFTVRMAERGLMFIADQLKRQQL